MWRLEVLWRLVETLGAILFNVFLCDIFFLIDTVDIASYSDDNTPYTIRKKQYEIEKKKEKKRNSVGKTI